MPTTQSYSRTIFPRIFRSPIDTDKVSKRRSDGVVAPFLPAVPICTFCVPRLCAELRVFVYRGSHQLRCCGARRHLSRSRSHWRAKFSSTSSSTALTPRTRALRRQNTSLPHRHRCYAFQKEWPRRRTDRYAASVAPACRSSRSLKTLSPHFFRCVVSAAGLFGALCCHDHCLSTSLGSSSVGFRRLGPGRSALLLYCNSVDLTLNLEISRLNKRHDVAMELPRQVPAFYFERRVQCYRRWHVRSDSRS
jgi:hypothetical protein